jgi:argininosuccinate lyase
MQEDKATLFSTVDTLKAVIEVVVRMLPHIRFKAETLQRQSRTGFLNATDMADYLVGQGMAFREAHAVVGKAVAHAIAQGKELHDLNLSELQSFSTLIDEGVFEALKLARVIDRRTSWGGTATSSVKAAIDQARQDLAAESLPVATGESP